MNLLTICIPTYNRAAKLNENLKNLAAIFSNLQVQCAVKVVVSNNNSSDDTHNVCKQYLHHEWFSYVKQKQNIGLDGQHFFFSQNIETEYIWIVGDDDFIPKESLLSVIDVISTYNSNAIFLNVSLKRAKNRWDYSFYPKNYPQLIQTSKVETALNIVKDNFQFISSQIFKLKTVKKDYKTGFDYGLKDINIYVALVAMSHTSIILPHVFILTNQSSNDRSQDNYNPQWVLTFWDRPMQAIRLYEKMYKKLDDRKIYKFLNRQDFQFIRTYLTYATDKSNYIQPNLSDIIYLHSWQSKLLATLLIITPNYILSRLMYIFRSLKSLSKFASK